jgi:hypothetical protein
MREAAKREDKEGERARREGKEGERARREDKEEERARREGKDSLQACHTTYLPNLHPQPLLSNPCLG